MGGLRKYKADYRPLLFEDKPLFGLDIGHDELRVVQFDMKHKLPRLIGYGSTGFDSNAIENGVVVRPELIARSALKLFSKELVGSITTSRAAVSLPAHRALTRTVQLPKMNQKDIKQAVQNEADQYIPMQADSMYLDYTVLREDENGIEVFIVAMPKEVVDSHLLLTRMMGIEAVLFDTAIGASAQLFGYSEHSVVPSVLIDFGSATTDITVYNRGLVVTGTVGAGGDDITVAIARALRVTPSEALMLKKKYGLVKSVFQKDIVASTEPILQTLLKEVRRTIRYYEQRYSQDEPIGQVVTMGGGSIMPGISNYFTDQLRLQTQIFDPANHIDFGALRSFYDTDRMSYVTAAGLAIANPKELFI